MHVFKMSIMQSIFLFASSWLSTMTSWNGIHRSPANSLHKGQWRGALVFSLVCVWINGWVNNREAGDLRRHRTHYDVIVMQRCVGADALGHAGHTIKYLFVISWITNVCWRFWQYSCCLLFLTSLRQFSKQPSPDFTGRYEWTYPGNMVSSEFVSLFR